MITDATTVQEAAEIYAGMGLAPIRLYGIVNGGCACGDATCRRKSHGKHPVGEAWQKNTATDLDRVRDIFRKHRGNIGVYLANQFVLIDADGDVGLATVASLNLPETYRQTSGSGNGAHFIFRLAPHQDGSLITDRNKVLPGVDVKIRGQFAAAPSLHASGNRYQLTNAMAPILLPDSLFEAIKTPVRAAAPKSSATKSTAVNVKRARAWLAKAEPAVSGENGHSTMMRVASFIIAQELTEGEEWELLCEYNQRCTPPWSEKELRHKQDEARRVGKGTKLEDRTLAVVPPRVELMPDNHWMDQLIWTYSRKGDQKIAQTLDNAVVILTNDPRWKGRIWLDTFAGEVTCQDPPWFDHQRAANRPAHWIDSDTSRLQGWLLRTYTLDLSIGDLERAVAVVSEQDARSSVKEWMETLKWDGVRRLDAWCPTYLGSPNNEYTQLVGRLWLISAVARSYVPGCKVDHVLILEGLTGLRKSAALEILASRDWFSDTSFEIGSLGAFLAMRKRLIVEMAELDSLKRSDADRAKAFFTSPVDTYRPPYGRRVISVPRQCIFAGTTNNREMLRDPTGNRRYWPVHCTKVDRPKLTADREQLWAEAVDAYKNGANWWPETDHERDLCAAAQDDHHIHDEWETIITEWADANSVTKATGADIAERALRMFPKDFQRGQQMHLAECLKRCGWESKRDKTHRYWVRGDGSLQGASSP